MNHNYALTNLVNRLYDKYVSHEDATLLNLVFAKHPTQELLEQTMQVCDIEAMGGNKVILLSYLMHDHPELTFSPYEAPRLKGLITYFRFANLKTLAHFSRIGKALNEANIPMILLKGAALKNLRPDLSRPMGDVDILVHKKDMQAAIALGEEQGYEAFEEPHSVDLHKDGENAVDMHHAVFMENENTEKFYQGLFQRAKPTKAFGVHFLLPCHEDLFFLALTNFTKNLREHSSLNNIYYALCDSKFLMHSKTDFDWGIVYENAKYAHKELEIRFAAEFINRIVPELIPDIDKHFPATSKMEAFCNQIVFDEKYFKNLQSICQKILVLQLKQKPRYYGKLILKLLVAKKLRNIPAFVRWYLNYRNSKG